MRALDSLVVNFAQKETCVYCVVCIGGKGRNSSDYLRGILNAKKKEIIFFCFSLEAL